LHARLVTIFYTDHDQQGFGVDQSLQVHYKVISEETNYIMYIIITERKK